MAEYARIKIRSYFFTVPQVLGILELFSRTLSYNVLPAHVRYTPPFKVNSEQVSFSFWTTLNWFLPLPWFAGGISMCHQAARTPDCPVSVRGVIHTCCTRPKNKYTSFILRHFPIVQHKQNSDPCDYDGHRHGILAFSNSVLFRIPNSNRTENKPPS